MNNETLADIIREMRDIGALDEQCGDMIPRNLQALGLRTYADRLEAAVARERGALVAEAEAAKDARNKVAVRLREEFAERCRECKAKSGNAAANRAALSDACYAMFNFLKTQGGGYEEMAIALDKAKAALAAPPRNCDVGTAEEQSARMAEFCRAQYEKSDGVLLCSRCQFNGRDCQFAWAQMPYEAEGGAK